MEWNTYTQNCKHSLITMVIEAERHKREFTSDTFNDGHNLEAK